MIQVVEGEKWERRARRQHFFVVEEPFHRGTFFSNVEIKQGHPLQNERFVVDVQKFHLHIDPLSIPEERRGSVVQKLSSLLDMMPNQIAVELQKRSRDRLLKMWIEVEEKEKVLHWWKGFAKENKLPRNALFFVSDYKRSYPFGSLLGQVLHTVQDKKNEKTGQACPTGGLELQFDSQLQGKVGKRLMMRSPRHSLELGAEIIPPENGADIYLTINHHLQAIVEEELQRGVKKCGAKSGWAILMEPKTGEILALAQAPGFHPGHYMDYFNDPVLLDHTRVKAVSDANEPGSSFKPFTILAAFLANEELKKSGKPPCFDPEEKIACADGHFPGRKKPITDVHVHKYLNLAMGLKESSNIYTGRVIDKVIKQMGCNWYRNFLSTIGCGRKTGIELPGETAGVLPTPGKVLPNGKMEWSVPTPYSLAMGYNIQLNDIQLMRAWSLFANGGYLVKPTLIKKIVKGEMVLYDHTKDAKPEPIFDPKLIEMVLANMRFDTQAGGTGKLANIVGFTEIGKTGSARKIVNGQYTTKKHIVSFIGFAPATDPAFLLLVVMDEPEVRFIPYVGPNHHGGVAAAPVFNRIGTRTLEYLGRTPDDPYGYSPSDPRYDPEKAIWVKEGMLLREKYNLWNK